MSKDLWDGGFSGINDLKLRLKITTSNTTQKCSKRFRLASSQTLQTDRSRSILAPRQTGHATEEEESKLLPIVTSNFLMASITNSDGLHLAVSWRLLVTSSNGLQPNSDGLHLVASCH